MKKQCNQNLQESITPTGKNNEPRSKRNCTKHQKDDRTECIAKNNAFVTMKDHKRNFRSATPCRLINPCKSELGKICKIILENINKTLIERLNANQ